VLIVYLCDPVRNTGVSKQTTNVAARICWVKSLNVPRSWDGGVLKYWNTDKYKIRYGLRV